MQEEKLTVIIRRSRWLLAYIFSVHMLMSWTLWQLDLPNVWAVCGSILLVLSLWYQLGRYQWRYSRLAVVEVSFQAADHNTAEIWTLRYADKQLLSPYQLISSVVVADMVIMRLRKRFPTRWWMRHETVLLLAGSVEPAAFRQLRLLLRQRGINPTDAE